MNFRNFQSEQGPSFKNAGSTRKIHHEVLLLVKFLQTKHQSKSLNINYYEFYYTVIKNGEDNEIVNDKIDNTEKGYNNFNDFITPSHHIGPKNNIETLRWRNLTTLINLFK